MGWSVYISDVVDCSSFVRGCMNVVTAGCGTGKTYWVVNKLLEQYPDVKPGEVLFITSRSITKKQVAKSDNTLLLTNRNIEGISMAWAGVGDEIREMIDAGIVVGTYNQLASLVCPRVMPLKHEDPVAMIKDGKLFKNLRILILDECHAIYCDTFMRFMESVNVFIREQLRFRDDIVVIGLTATPEILKGRDETFNIPMHFVTPHVLSKYRVKNMFCTDRNSSFKVLNLVHNPDDKAIIMCRSVDDCKRMAKRLGNATVICSENRNSTYTPEMARIRNYIVEHEELPPTYYDNDGHEIPLKYLLSTTTLREGFNLRETSGVRTVMTYIPDAIHVVQFVGRCRYSVDNLIVVDTYRDTLIREDEQNYLLKSRRDFSAFMDGDGWWWWSEVSPVFAGTRQDVRKYVGYSDVESFLQWFDRRYLATGKAEKNRNKWIIRKEGAVPIVQAAIKYGAMGNNASKYNFNAIRHMMEQEYGYIFETHMDKDESGQFRYWVATGKKRA